MSTAPSDVKHGTSRRGTSKSRGSRGTRVPVAPVALVAAPAPAEPTALVESPAIISLTNNSFNRRRRTMRYTALIALASVGAMYLMGKNPLAAQELVQEAVASGDIGEDTVDLFRQITQGRGFNVGSKIRGLIGSGRKTMKNKRRSH